MGNITNSIPVPTYTTATVTFDVENDIWNVTGLGGGKKGFGGKGWKRLYKYPSQIRRALYQFLQTSYIDVNFKEGYIKALNKIRELENIEVPVQYLSGEIPDFPTEWLTVCKDAENIAFIPAEMKPYLQETENVIWMDDFNEACRAGKDVRLCWDNNFQNPNPKHVGNKKMSDLAKRFNISTEMDGLHFYPECIIDDLPRAKYVACSYKHLLLKPVSSLTMEDFKRIGNQVESIGLYLDCCWELDKIVYSLITRRFVQLWNSSTSEKGSIHSDRVLSRTLANVRLGGDLKWESITDELLNRLDFSTLQNYNYVFDKSKEIVRELTVYPVSKAQSAFIKVSEKTEKLVINFTKLLNESEEDNNEYWYNNYDRRIIENNPHLKSITHIYR